MATTSSSARSPAIASSPTAHRRPFRSPADTLGDRLASLAPEDLTALLHMLDALIAKKRVQAALTSRAG